MPPADLTRRDAARLGLAVGTGFCATHALGLGIARADALAAHEPTEPHASFGDPAQLARELEAAGCIVQHGSFQEPEHPRSASEGKLISCFGNNAGSTYLVNFLPPAPNQEPAAAVPEHGGRPRSRARSLTLTPRKPFPRTPTSAPRGGRTSYAPTRPWSWLARCRRNAYFSLINYVLLLGRRTRQRLRELQGVLPGFGPGGRETIAPPGLRELWHAVQPVPHGDRGDARAAATTPRPTERPLLGRASCTS